MKIGQLDPVPLRELWRHEAHNFTTWLAENLDHLNDKLNLDLALINIEVSIGTFSADIQAEDAQGNLVVIENQLERTDHDHLGKLITYMSNMDAKIAIWITSDPRPEHEQAVHWLNEALPADTAFYLVKLEAFRIGDSNPAPLFSVVAGPSVEARQIGVQKKVTAERHMLRLAFWEQLLERAKARTQLHARRAPTQDNWITAGAGKSGLSYCYSVKMQSTSIELVLDSSEATKNKLIFDQLIAHKQEIEDRFGGSLIWERHDDYKKSMIFIQLPNGGVADQDRWPEIHATMIDAMINLEKAFSPHIRTLTI